MNRKSGRRLRLVAWITLAAAVVAGLVVAMLPKPIPVELAEVHRGVLRVTIDEEGETRVRDRFVVSAPAAGRVLRIALEAGDRVTAGETVLARLQPMTPAFLDQRSRAEAEARVRAAEAAVGRVRAERARAQVDLARTHSERERVRRLADDAIVAPDRLEAIEAESGARQEVLRAAQFALSGAEHDLERARATLLQPSIDRAGASAAPIEVRSPVDGTVLRLLHKSEAVVAAGELLVEVADAEAIEIVADLLSTDAVRVSAGDRVVVERWGGEGPLDGRVRRIEPSGFTKVSALGVEEQRVNVIIDLVGDSSRWRGLGDGFRVEIKVVVWEGTDVLQLPPSSLFRHGDSWAVFAVEDRRARLREVAIGRRNGDAAELLEGLAVGQVVIVHPGDAIEDGAQVEPRNVASGPAGR